MKPLYFFIGMLAVAAACFISAPARAADMNTDCAQAAQNAENFARLTAEIAQVGNQVESTGSELASHVQGQAGTQVASRLQRTTESIQAALRELHGALESVHASCQQYNALGEQVLHPMGMLRSSAQYWDFAAIQTGASQMQANQARLVALTNEVQAARGDFGVHRDRAVARLHEAQQSMSQMNQAITDAAQAMRNSEKCISGRFSDGTKCNSRR